MFILLLFSFYYFLNIFINIIIIIYISDSPVCLSLHLSVSITVFSLSTVSCSNASGLHVPQSSSSSDIQVSSSCGPTSSGPSCCLIGWQRNPSPADSTSSSWWMSCDGGVSWCIVGDGLCSSSSLPSSSVFSSTSSSSSVFLSVSEIGVTLFSVATAALCGVLLLYCWASILFRAWRTKVCQKISPALIKSQLQLPRCILLTESQSLSFKLTKQETLTPDWMSSAGKAEPQHPFFINVISNWNICSFAARRSSKQSSEHKVTFHH